MINTLLLENMQEASVAVTHDAEWISAILQDESTIPDGRTLYRRLCDRYSVRVSEDGGVFFDSESSNNYNASPESSILGVLPIPHNESNAWHDSDVQSKKGRRWSIGSLLGSLGRRSAGGRSSRPLQLETQSDIDNPWLNNPATEETPTRTSLAIDGGLAIEKHSRSHLRNVRILLLGQSESGKSTFLRQFQRLYDPENFEKKRMSWRPVIQLNLISSIRTILSAVSANAALLRLDSGRLSPSEESDAANSDPASMREGDLEFPITSHIENLADALLPLLELEDVVNHASTDENLSEHFQKALNFPGQLPNNAENALIPQELHVSSKEMETATQAVLHSLSGSMVRLWEDPDVQATLDAKMIRLEDSPGFFLNDLSRVTALDYVPADDDVMKARLETIGALEHKFEMKTSEYRPDETWSIIDVGGSRTQRHNWLSFFDQVDAIIFLAPMSCFDQYLREDSSVNRLEDSVALWKTICSNTILQRVSLILFLNKYDIFDRKLKSGIQLSKYLPSYKDRLNDVQTASSYLRSQFRGIHKRLSPSPRAYYSYFTSVTDAPSSVKIIGSVRETVVRQNLTSSALI
ncbi:G-protein alpha subunit-domain-containing protein [Mycena crocata]|nr:G-protein alpha subunit-domain-containing protein [Mycena crocata]